MLVYRILNLINGKSYIGQTRTSIQRRYSSGLAKSRKNFHLTKAVRKYGESNFRIDVVRMCLDLDALNYWEKYYINLFETCDPHKGYNLKTGGVTASYDAPEYCKRLSDQIRKAYADPIKRNNNARAHGQRPFNVYNKTTGEFVGTWENASQCGKDLGFSASPVSTCLRKKAHYLGGYVFAYTDESIPLHGDALEAFLKERNEKARKALTPYFQTLEYREKMGVLCRENPFYAYKLPDGIQVGSWHNAKICADTLGLPCTSEISTVLSGRKNSYYGYVFSYDPALVITSEIIEERKRQRRSQSQKSNPSRLQGDSVICITTGKQYISLKQASDEMKLDRKKISLVCKGVLPDIGGYVFKFN